MWTVFAKLMQSRENEKTDKRSEPLEGKCGSIYAELEFPGRKWPESRMLCRLALKAWKAGATVPGDGSDEMVRATKNKLILGWHSLH